MTVEVLTGMQAPTPSRYSAAMAGAHVNALRAIGESAAQVKAKKAAEQQQLQASVWMDV